MAANNNRLVAAFLIPLWFLFYFYNPACLFPSPPDRDPNFWQLQPPQSLLQSCISIVKVLNSSELINEYEYLKKKSIIHAVIEPQFKL